VLITTKSVIASGRSTTSVDEQCHLGFSSLKLPPWRLEFLRKISQLLGIAQPESDEKKS